jgi:hypothetical protein
MGVPAPPMVTLLMVPASFVPKCRAGVRTLDPISLPTFFTCIIQGAHSHNPKHLSQNRHCSVSHPNIPHDHGNQCAIGCVCACVPTRCSLRGTCESGATRHDVSRVYFMFTFAGGYEGQLPSAPTFVRPRCCAPPPPHPADVCHCLNGSCRCMIPRRGAYQRCQFCIKSGT